MDHSKEWEDVCSLFFNIEEREKEKREKEERKREKKRKERERKERERKERERKERDHITETVSLCLSFFS